MLYLNLSASLKAGLSARAVAGTHSAFSASRLLCHRQLRQPQTFKPLLLPSHGNFRNYTTNNVNSSQSDKAVNEEDDAMLRKCYLYFDSAFPIRLGFWDIRYLLASLEKRTTLDRIRASLPPESDVGYGFKVENAKERMKDGGAFVMFSYRADDASESTQQTLDVIEKRLKQGAKRVFNPAMGFVGTPGVHVVRGKPFHEDMNVFPSTRIQVQLQGGDANQEQLYELLRPYGRIVSITKDKPNEALVTFARVRGATSARNCAHGIVLSNGARMVISYNSHLRAKILWGWLTSHPRIVFPLLIFLFGGLSYAFFEPLRTFFIESKIQNTFSLQNSKVYTWLKNNTVGLFKEQTPTVTSQYNWWERRESAQNIRGWIREVPSTFITVSGPIGSGKSALIEKAITKDVLHLVIDCDVMAKNAKNDAALVSTLASETGYWPVFGFLNSWYDLMDIASAGLIGSKAGFATPIDAQLKQILNTVTSSLNQINADTQKSLDKIKQKRQKAAQKVHKAGDPKDESLASGNTFGEKANELMAFIKCDEPTDQEAKSFDWPVVVIKHFHHKSIKQPIIHSVLAEWASELVTNRIAHVIFVSDHGVAMGKELTKALPNVPFQNIILADADQDKARSYVFNKLKELGKLDVIRSKEQPIVGPSSAKTDTDTVNVGSQGSDSTTEPTALDDEAAIWIDKLGGRLTDLEALVQKVNLGQSVQTAVEEIIARTVIELRKNGFGEDTSESNSLAWNRQHIWTIIQSLAENNEINYFGLMHNSLKGDDAPIKALEQAEIISVKHYDGRPSVIRAGRPVLLEAMKKLLADPIFYDTQILLSNNTVIESAEKFIRSIELEIKDISEMIRGSPFQIESGSGSTGVVIGSNQTRWLGSSSSSLSISAANAAKARTEYLLHKMAQLQVQISQLEAENKQIKKNLLHYRDH